jgi:hypothetical protein
MKKEKDETAIIPHSFDVLVGDGLSKAQARDMMRKHLIKLELDVKVNELEVTIEAIKREVIKNPTVSKYKEMRKLLRQVRRDQQKATDTYLGSVSTGLINVLPGKNLSEKLMIINQMADIKQLK